MNIDTPVYTKAMNKLQLLYDGFRTAQEFERGLLLYGSAGTGKTYILNKFERLYPAIETEERTIRPVVRITIDDPRIESVLLSLLSAYGLPVTYSKKSKDMTDTAIRCIGNSETRVLLIDEASQIAEHRGDKTVRKSSDFLKTLINFTDSAVVCAGVNSLLKLSEANQQFRDRYSSKIHTHVWGIGAKETRSDFVAYVIKYAKHKNIIIPQIQASLPLLEGILYASDGRQRKVNHLIDTVARLFPHSEGQDLLQLFMKGFKEFAQCESNVRNPFHSAFNGKELTGRGELYAPEPINL